MKTLTGNISYELSFTDKEYKLKFPNPTTDFEDAKNAFACIYYTKIVAENTLNHYNKSKKEDRSVYNSLYKKNHHTIIRLVSELNQLLTGTLEDITQNLPADEVSKVTVQNEIVEE